MSDWKSRASKVDGDWKSRSNADEGEPGNPGHDLYADGATAHQPTEPEVPDGTVGDAVKTWANKAALGAGPQIEGVMGALAHAAVDPMQLQGTDADAYRSVRDEGEREHAASENTTAGRAAIPLGIMSTPLPGVKGDPLASIPERAWDSAKVGGALGFAQGASGSKGNWKQTLAQALIGGTLGAGAGAATGAGIGIMSPRLRSFAEENALKAAGARGGIANGLQKMGMQTEDEALARGRDFLNEDLIPWAGSKRSVQARADQLADKAGTSQQAQLAKAQASGVPVDATRMANAARQPLQVGKGASTAVADIHSGKAHDFADALDAQGEATPGDWAELNRAKSDAWKSARFDQDAPVAAQLYRKSVGSARDDLVQQIRDIGKRPSPPPPMPALAKPAITQPLPAPRLPAGQGTANLRLPAGSPVTPPSGSAQLALPGPRPSPTPITPVTQPIPRVRTPTQRAAVLAQRQTPPMGVAAASGKNWNAVADALTEANRKYGIAADARKLSENAGTRDLAKSSFNLKDLAAAATAGGGVGATGHSLGAMGTAAAVGMGSNWVRNHGPALAARTADGLTEQTGGGIGATTSALAPYLELLMEKKDGGK